MSKVPSIQSGHPEMVQLAITSKLKQPQLVGKNKQTSVVYPSNILQVLIIAPFMRHPTSIFTSIAKPSLAMGLARASDKE